MEAVQLLSVPVLSRAECAAYPESVATFPEGLISFPCALPSKARSQSSRHVSLLKSISTAPAFVPVAIKGDAVPGDQANAAVRGISLKRTIMFGIRRNDSSDFPADPKDHEQYRFCGQCDVPTAIDKYQGGCGKKKCGGDQCDFLV
jgi:hypothetical protein